MINRGLLLILFTCVLHPFSSVGQTRPGFTGSLVGAVDSRQNAWVDSVFKKLKRKEKIAQLFMVRAHTNLGKAYEDSVAGVIKKQKIGGVVFFQGGPVRQAVLTNYYQSISKVPLLVAIDAEWGLGMRLDSTISYPYQMTLGAISDNALVYQMGRKIGQDLKRIGVGVNFAPVVDVNNNPANPVIGYRSFGDNKYNVAAKAAAYMNGLQDEGLLVSLKHFPGHGDTDVDSHLDLPQLPFDRKRLDSLEMYPFRELVRQGASGVMVAHISIPALDSTAHLPATLSRPIVTGILKEDIGFKGLVFSDAMEMKGVVKYFPDGEADVRALIAGTDVVELSQNSERAINMVSKAMRKKRLTKDQVYTSVKKVLAAKYWMGLSHRQPVDTASVVSFLNRPEALAFNQQLADSSITLLRSDSLLRAFDPTRRTALISVGVTEVTSLQKQLQQTFRNSTNFILSKIASTTDLSRMMTELRNYDQVVLAVYDYRKRPGAVLDYNTELKSAIAVFARLNTLTCVFANPYAVASLPGIEQSKTLLMSYQNGEEQQRAAAKVITGQLQPSGKLPVSINAYFKNGDGR